jgi:hypothetical protein
MRFLATLVLTVAVAGCGLQRTNPEPPPRPTPEPTPVYVTLTAQAVTASIPMPRTTAVGGVRMTVVSLNNPAGQGLLIKVTLKSPDGHLADLGTISPYPVDRPGSSAHLQLPDEDVDDSGRPADLRLRMTALPDGASLDSKLAITLAVTPTQG